MEMAMKRIASVALIGIGVFACGVTNASAYVACNHEGDCWHTNKGYKYPPEAHVRLFPDTWKYNWRGEGQGSGYWSKDNWVNTPMGEEMHQEWE